MKNSKLLQYHSICSLLAGSLLILLGITGSILVFNSEIDEVLFERYQTKNSPAVLNLDTAITEVQKIYRDWRTRIIHFKEGETIIFNLRRPDQRKLVFVHPENGTILGEVDENSHFTKWLLKFHYSLHAGNFGRILVLICGMLFLISIITGILLYRKSIVKILLFRVKIKRKNKRAFFSSLHRYIGVWSILLNLILALTGALLAYTVTTSGLKTPKEPDPPLVETSVENVLIRLEKEIPEFSPSYIRLASSAKAPIVINGAFQDDPFVYSIHYNKVSINNKTGEVESIKKTSEESIIYKANSMITPLHYGQFAGLFGKLVYSIIGISGPALSITGYIIWYKRKRVKYKKNKNTAFKKPRH